MTGPEHYREAQRLLAQAAQEHGAGCNDNALFLSGQAQVHAMLAVAAATVVQPSGYGCDRPEWIEWAAVASVESSQRKRREDPVTCGQQQVRFDVTCDRPVGHTGTHHSSDYGVHWVARPALEGGDAA